jgi:hypothetical protein
LSLEIFAERKEESGEEFFADFLLRFLLNTINLLLLSLLLFFEELLVLSLILSLELREILFGYNTNGSRSPFELLKILDSCELTKRLSKDVVEAE